VPGASSRSTPAPSAEPATSVGAIECRLASSDDDLEAHFELRRAVFVDEQRLFELDDHDARDDARVTLHALGLIDGEPCGAVRLYPLDRSWRRWKGDRLAVLPELRTHHLGAELVRFAVSTAGQLGGDRMVAHVQVPNVRFFEHLGWRREGSPAPFHGIDHQLMSIGLGRGA
jgi:putative N-acetyltransferase (TIGR04045 family)